MQSDTLLKVDDLTALPTHTAMIEHLTLESIQAKTLQQVLSLILLDIDDFAIVNARWNKRVGDQVIIRVADALRLFLRDMDFLARIGPQKFAILLPDTTLEPALELAEQLRLIVARIHCEDVAEGLTLSASLGVASQLGCGKAEPLFLQAEAMLSQAKALGRNQVCP
jgi:diguanylate cyclase (GGDEF)-like protein